MKGVMSLSVCPLDMGRANSAICWNTNLVEIARAIIIVSALVAILSSSSSVSKDNIGTEECLCRDNLYFCAAPEAVTTAKWRDVLEREQFSSRIVTMISVKHIVSQNGEFIARYCSTNDNDIYASAPMPASLFYLP